MGRHSSVLNNHDVGDRLHVHRISETEEKAAVHFVKDRPTELSSVDQPQGLSVWWKTAVNHQASDDLTKTKVVLFSTAVAERN